VLVDIPLDGGLALLRGHAHPEPGCLLDALAQHGAGQGFDLGWLDLHPLPSPNLAPRVPLGVPGFADNLLEPLQGGFEIRIWHEGLWRKADSFSLVTHKNRLIRYPFAFGRVSQPSFRESRGRVRGMGRYDRPPIAGTATTGVNQLRMLTPEPTAIKCMLLLANS
jgi:hypothetical protein